ncbi:MAG: CoA ester lyase [Rhodobacteraceae bacterium]|nr:CoA ester lyase [Paracoccaceae bacterium]
MTLPERPHRSVLYIPGDKPRALDKARNLPCDAIIFDLEDAVGPDAKEAARVTLRNELAKGGYGARKRLVRINGFDTHWGKRDIETLRDAEFDGVLIPKVSSGWDVEVVAELTGDRPLWAMMETPQAFMNACEIASHTRIAGLVMGTNDLVKDLGCRNRADRLPLMSALQICVLAARAAQIVAVDGVYNAFKDDEGLAAECEQGRDLGFDGKTLIHPAQLAIANAAFAPGEDELIQARRQIEAFEAAEAEGKGVAVLDGRIVESLHIVTARALLAKAAAISELES